MAKYRVTVRVSSVEVVEADNPYQAAVVVSDRHDGTVEIADVRPAVGRAGGASKTSAKKAGRSVKKVAKKRRTLSPEARARLAQNLVKARAARAAKRKGATKKAPVKKKAAKKARKATKKRASRRA